MIKEFLFALTPALSPEEREAFSSSRAHIEAGSRLSLWGRRTTDANIPPARNPRTPSPGGEGRGEGEHNSAVAKFAIAFALILSLTTLQTARAATPDELVANWLRAQPDIQTWSADFTQTRKLKSLTEPLKSTGQVWFAAPNRFHWELGQPAQTIAIRQPDQMLVIYPKLKRIEKYPLHGKEAGPWRDALALLEAGFPRDENELQSRFKIQSIDVKDDVCELTLQPRSSSARAMMSLIKIAFGTNDYSLRATELEFADGSTMRNDFNNPKVNEKQDAALFSPNLDPAFKVIEPLKK